METALEDLAIISFKDGQRGVEQITFRDDDDIESRGDVVLTKNLSNQSFSAVPLNRPTELFGGGDSEPSHLPLVRKDKHRCEAPVKACAPLVNLLELRAPSNVLVRQESGQSIRC